MKVMIEVMIEICTHSVYPGWDRPVILSSSVLAVRSSTVVPSGRTMVIFLSDPRGVYV